MGFHRKPFNPRRRRPRPGPHQGPQVAPPVRRALEHALQLQQIGEFAEAAQIYSRLAEEAYQRQRIRPAVQMDLEAGRACMKAQAHEQAQKHALRALRALLDAGIPPARVLPVIDRIIEHLKSQGAEKAALEFRAQVDHLLQTHEVSPQQLQPQHPAPSVKNEEATLPAQCPSCGAPLYANEIEWLEPTRAKCSYCGSIILLQQRSL